MIPQNLPSDTPQPTAVDSPTWANDSVCASPDLPAYAELYSLSNFSFLRAASFPEELVEQAHELGYSALALCDECSLSGIVRAHVAAKQRGLKLLIGSVSRAKGGDSLERANHASAEFTEINVRPSCSATCSHATRLWSAEPSHQLRAEGSGEGGLLGRQADGRGQFTRGVLCAVVTSFGKQPSAMPVRPLG